MTYSDVLVIGAGASGMAAAISAAENNESVVLLERFERPGKKLLATGNGRCNLMNTGPLVYYGDSAFANAVVNRCGIKEQTEFWNRYGLKLREETEGRVYPFPMRSSAVLDILIYALHKNKVSIRNNSRVLRVENDENGFQVYTDHDAFSCRRLIVSTGGPAQPRLGGNRDGYRILTSFGHTLMEPVPALTPLRTDHRSVSGLDGIRVKCKVRIILDGKTVHCERGELLFTKDGVSGICVMQCARFAVPGESELSIDLTDGAFGSESDLYRLLYERRSMFPDDLPEKLIEGILLPKMAYALCKQAGLKLRGEKTGELTDKQIRQISMTMMDYRLKIEDRCDFDYAQISAGGICCNEFRNDTMESRLCKSLYATGEVLDTDGDCGGFNLMFAFASGILAGKNRRA